MPGEPRQCLALCVRPWTALLRPAPCSLQAACSWPTGVRVVAAQIMFETFNASSYYTCTSAALTVYSYSD